MSEPSIRPIWDTAACVPRNEVLHGTLTDADLALRLNAVVSGTAKAPYNDPRTFFESTHLTRSMGEILQYLFGRISGARSDTNPVIVLDVGFGGGKTHTLVSLYYAAKFGNDPTVKSYLSGIPIPNQVRIVAASGEDFGDLGLSRNGIQISTLWGDIFYQLGCYDQFKNYDLNRQVPSLEEIKSALGDGPILILLDELPTYFNLVGKHDQKMMDSIIQFIQRLVIGIAEKENGALVIAIAEDAYKGEANLARESIRAASGQAEEDKRQQLQHLQAAEDAMDQARAHIRRKEFIMSPVEEEDVVHILKRRLFSSINEGEADVVSKAYHSLYNSIQVPEQYKKQNYQELIQNSYPFHPELIKILYERLATLDRFNRTRGALRLLNRVVRQIWKEQEDDAYLIHPFHVDMAVTDIMEDLTKGIGEEKLRNAVEADIWRSGGGATAQDLDDEVKIQWKAPLHKRTCNTIYLYSLATGREGDHGIEANELTTLLALPGRSDFAVRVRDVVLKKVTSDFHYIDRRGTNYLFIREPSPLRVIDKEARDITEDEATDIIREVLDNLFSDKPDWISPKIFPSDPSKLEDEPVIKIALLNPHLHHFLPDSGDIPEAVSRFITHKDTQGKNYRRFKNDTFLLVAEQSRMALLWDTAKKLKAARIIRPNLSKYGIPKDRSTEVEEYLSDHENMIYDHVRSAFCKFIYYDKQAKIKVASLNPNGYSNGKGRAMFAYHLKDVFHRVSEEAFDPILVETDAWSAGTPYVSTETLFETFHIKPGLVIPANQETFVKTIKRGINERIWIIRAVDKIYTDEQQASSIAINSEWELWKKEEAAREGLLRPKTVDEEDKTKGYNVSKKTTDKQGTLIGGDEPQGPRPFTYSFQDSPADTIATDFETYVRRERVKNIEKIVIKSKGIPSVLFAIKNILTKIGPEKCAYKIHIHSERYQTPKYSVNIELQKDAINENSSKKLLEVLPQLQDSENFNVSLNLEWPDVETDKLAQLIREMAKTNPDSLFNLEISGMLEKS